MKGVKETEAPQARPQAIEWGVPDIRRTLCIIYPIMREKPRLGQMTARIRCRTDRGFLRLNILLDLDHCLPNQAKVKIIPLKRSAG